MAEKRRYQDFTKGKPKLRLPALRKARALSILEGRLQGKTLETLAREHNISEATVTRDINYLERQGLLDDARHKVVAELVPEALTAAKKALQGAGDKVSADMASNVLHGTGVLNKHAARQTAEEGEMTLETWRERVYLPSLTTPEGAQKALEAEFTRQDDPDPQEGEEILSEGVRATITIPRRTK